ncbi:transporter substrate-binding domain-containing protein [Aestuariibacter halophilus]|uniref:Transporter substrate-binding domain-containing protein n=2 Tax=Fluctibacter halophilus TaxID=226011 RepID=A0ABS8GFE8_9ALTE|nr:transporter substrate-binding domain-containing protein [Aestuariibacter halophilus]
MLKTFSYVCTLLLLGSFHPAATADGITITTSEYPPYMSEEHPHQGFVADVVRCAFGTQGIGVKFLFVNWVRAYDLARDGEYPASAYWFYTDERAKDFYYSDPMHEETLVLVKRRRNPIPSTWSGLDSFSDVRIGMTRGYSYTPDWQAFARQHQNHVSVVNTDAQNIEMLLLDRIDVFPVDELMLWHILHSRFAPEQRQLIEVMQPVLGVQQGHVLFSRKHPDGESLKVAFNAGLAQCRRDGTLETLEQQLIKGFYAPSPQTISTEH